MFTVFRIVRGKKYYKEIAKMIGSEIFTINEDIPYKQGDCILYDEKKANPRVLPIDQAKTQALSLDLDLILLKQTSPPSLQLKPYIYSIYKQFYRKAGGRKGIGTKTIPISNRIMQHDLKTKKYIVQQLLKKGHNRFNLVGTNNSEQNKQTIQKFCRLMQWQGNYHFSLETRGTGKITMDYWVCHVDCGDVKLPLNYKSLDKKYENMLREERFTGKVKWKGEEEEDEDWEEQFNQEEYYQQKSPTERFREMVRRADLREKEEIERRAREGIVDKKREDTHDEIMAKAKETIKKFNAQSDDDLEEEIKELQGKGSQITDIQYKRLLKLRNEWKLRRRILQ